MATRYGKSAGLTLSRSCFLEVVIAGRSGSDAGKRFRKVVTYDSDEDSVTLVREEMDRVLANVLKVTVMERRSVRAVEETSSLFERMLEPWFSRVSEGESDKKLLHTMSRSLKKALILLAMDRFHADEVSVAHALGLTLKQLDREMARCGIRKGG